MEIGSAFFLFPLTFAMCCRIGDKNDDWYSNYFYSATWNELKGLNGTHQLAQLTLISIDGNCTKKGDINYPCGDKHVRTTSSRTVETAAGLRHSGSVANDNNHNIIGNVKEPIVIAIEQVELSKRSEPNMIAVRIRLTWAIIAWNGMHVRVRETCSLANGQPDRWRPRCLRTKESGHKLTIERRISLCAAAHTPLKRKRETTTQLTLHWRYECVSRQRGARKLPETRPIVYSVPSCLHSMYCERWTVSRNFSSMVQCKNGVWLGRHRMNKKRFSKRAKRELSNEIPEIFGRSSTYKIGWNN